jgi:hypothetical protein
MKGAVIECPFYCWRNWVRGSDNHSYQPQTVFLISFLIPCNAFHSTLGSSHFSGHCKSWDRTRAECDLSLSPETNECSTHVNLITEAPQCWICHQITACCLDCPGSRELGQTASSLIHYRCYRRGYQQIISRDNSVRFTIFIRSI